MGARGPAGGAEGPGEDSKRCRLEHFKARASCLISKCGKRSFQRALEAKPGKESEHLVFSATWRIRNTIELERPDLTYNQNADVVMGFKQALQVVRTEVLSCKQAADAKRPGLTPASPGGSSGTVVDLFAVSLRIPKQCYDGMLHQCLDNIR